MKRRKSRQSTEAPNIVDIEYAGDTARFSHLMGKRGSLVACEKPTASQINYEMTLRTYRNITDFNASQPWEFPTKKTFTPSD